MGSLVSRWIQLSEKASNMQTIIHPDSWMTHNPGVYIAINVTSNRAYIGSTDRSCKKRLKEHIAGLVAGKHHCKPLQLDWDLYGSEVFLFGDAISTFGVDALYERKIPVAWFESALFIAYQARYGPESTYNVAHISRAPAGIGLDRRARTCAEQYLQGIGVAVKVVSGRHLLGR